MNKVKSGILKFVDSTKLEVCKIWRVSYHKTMKELVNKSKSTTGWFYGLKLYIICDEKGNLLCIAFTSGNVDDRVILKEFLKQVSNSIIGKECWLLF